MNFLFDVTLVTSVRIDAIDEPTARILLKSITGYDALFHRDPNGESICTSVEIAASCLVEVDGEAP